MSKYKVNIDKFEGPLNLLLKLIEKEKLDITEVSLKKVTDQFLEHIKNLEEIDAENLADFLILASQLILIKSRALLPDLDIEDEEEISAEDLALRLKEYKRFKDQSRKIDEIYKNNKNSFEQEFCLQKSDAFAPGKNLRSKSLYEAMKLIVLSIRKFKDLAKKTVKQTISLKERIIDLQKIISKQAKLKFKNIIDKSQNKMEVVVSFLALLELVKQQIVDVSQDEIFGDILLKKKNKIKNNG
ncbi:MAG: segregation/condensation protein A [Parcubacteria group bacterium]|nr:segregation/condensation protein A [Parcubacteria group bacterium]